MRRRLRCSWRRPRPAAEPAAGAGRPDLIPADVLEAMPPAGILHDYVAWAVQETYAPPIFHLGAILPAWANMLTAWGWELPVRGAQGALQVFLIGSPASAKSTTLRMAMGFHNDVLQAWDPRQFDAERDTPWMQAEGTVAGMIEHLTDRFDADVGVTPAVLFHEEVSSLLAGGGSVIDIMMQVFDAAPHVSRQLVRYREARKRGETTPHRIERPAVGGVFCATTKSITDTLTERHFDGGLVSRSLWLTGQPALERYFGSGPAPGARSGAVTAWIQLGRYLPALGARGGARIVRESQESKRVLEPVDGAITGSDLYQRFCAAILEGRDAEGAALQRAMGQVRYIAALYALSQGRTETSADDTRRAVKLLEMSLAYSAVLFGRVAQDPVYRLVERAEQVIRSTGAKGIGRYDLNRYHLRTSKQTYDQVVAQLEEERGILTVTRPAESGRGRPATVFVASDLHEGPSGGVVIQFPKRSPEDAD